jgi:hypothetical protein
MMKSVLMLSLWELTQYLCLETSFIDVKLLNKEKTPGCQAHEHLTTA